MATTFHDASKPWARIKHGLVSGYLALFLGKLSSTASRVFYVDGFAGSGKLGDGSEGSPVYAARRATNPLTRTATGKLRCVNVEKEVFPELESALAPFASSGLITNLQGRFDERLPEILGLIGDSPALFFIDPFGTEGAESSTIEMIGQREKREVLIRYDDTRVKRLIKWVHAHRDSLDEQQRKTAEAFQQRCYNLTDEEAAQAVVSMLAEGDKEASRETLILSYLNLITKTTSFRFGLHFPIRNPETRGHRYYFAHFSQHPDGYIYMADHMAQAHRAYLREATDLLSRSSTVEPAFPSILKEADDEAIQQNVARLTDDLPDMLRSKLRPGVSTQNRHVFQWIVDAFKWKYLRKEYCAALKQLRDQGLVGFNDDKDGTKFSLLK